MVDPGPCVRRPWNIDPDFLVLPTIFLQPGSQGISSGALIMWPHQGRIRSILAGQILFRSTVSMSKYVLTLSLLGLLP